MSMQSGQSGQGFNMPNVGGSQVTQYLGAMTFPATKQKIIDQVKAKGAPESVVQMINRLPEKNYQNAADIESEFSKMK